MKFARFFFIVVIILTFTLNVQGTAQKKLRVFTYPKSPLATWISIFYKLAKVADPQLLPNHFYVKGLDLDPKGNIFPKTGWLKIYKSSFPVKDATYDVLLNCEAKFDTCHSLNLVPKIMEIVVPKLKGGEYINAFIDCEPINIQAPFVTGLVTSINTAGYGASVYINPGKYSNSNRVFFDPLFQALSNNRKNNVCIATYQTSLMQPTQVLIDRLEHQNIPYYICLDLIACNTQDLVTIIKSISVHHTSPLFQGLSIYGYDNEKVLFTDATAKMDLINTFYSIP